MYILEKYFRIFSERSGDEASRKNLTAIFDKLHSSLKNIKVQDLEIPKTGQDPIASVNVGELLGDEQLKDLDIWFCAKSKEEAQRTRGKFVNGKAKKRIELNVEVPVKNIEPEKWKKILAKNADVVLDRSKEVFWHEFTHYSDLKRIGSNKAYNRSVKATKSRNFDMYYNDPLEYNAFLQQGFAKLENFLNLATKEEAHRILGDHADHFYKIVLKVLPKDMEKHLTPEFKNKIKKRAYQMWKDVTGKFNGGSKNV